MVQRMLKGKFGWGDTNLRRGGGPYPLTDLDRKGPGGLNPRGVQIRGGSKSAGGPNPL